MSDIDDRGTLVALNVHEVTQIMTLIEDTVKRAPKDYQAAVAKRWAMPMLVMDRALPPDSPHHRHPTHWMFREQVRP